MSNAAATAHLTPFTKGDPRASEAARKSAAARRAKRAAVRAENEDVASHLRTLVLTHSRDELGPMAAAAAADMIGRVSRGEVAVKDPADWVRVLVDVARLESGLPTSASVVAHLGADGAARVLALQSRAREVAASSSVQAADDAGPSGAVVEGEVVEHEHPEA